MGMSLHQAGGWDHRKYGTLADPVHKSHMSTLIGEYACTEQFRRDRIREASGQKRETISGKTAMGTAGHNAIRRALASKAMRDALLGGASFQVAHVRKVVEEEFAKESSNYKDVAWYGKSELIDCLDDVVMMLEGLFKDFSRHVASIELVEAGWIAPVGEFWTEGHIDLVYRNARSSLGMTDWKTGATKPHPIELDHGFEGGLYSNALERGYFLPESVVEGWRNGAVRAPFIESDLIANAPTQREAMHIALRCVARAAINGEELPPSVVRFNKFPDEIRLTHLADYVPYVKKGTKKIEREEELEHWSRVLQRNVNQGESITYEKGQFRGPAWYNVRRNANDAVRLESRLATIVGWVRAGLFVDAVSEKCTRCSYREACLTTGYEARGADAEALSAAIDGFDAGEMNL